MKKLILVTLLLFTVVAFSTTSYADDFDFSGNFGQDNDVVLLDFLVGVTSNITIFSSSWIAGDSGLGFDPILAIWDSSGALLSQQDDGWNIGSTLSNGVSYDHGDWDTYYTQLLTAGSYQASIAQYNNFAIAGIGGNISLGFTHDSSPHFTYPTYGPQPDFNGVWNVPNDPRTSDWAFHILNVESADVAVVPIPGAVWLLGSGLIGLAGIRKKFKS